MDKRTIIIAEAGVNHNGDINLARKLVEAAAEAGADYVKFQTFNADSLVAREAKLADYQRENLAEAGDAVADQLSMLKRLEMSPQQQIMLRDYAAQLGIKFMSSPFDLQSIDFLHSLDLDYWKIPSGEVTDFPYLRKIGGFHGKVIMSTGMCSPDDINRALDTLARFGTPRSNVTLLHCTTQYPAPLDSVNLRAMQTLRSFDTAGVGYSDHTRGIEIPIAAAALGADIIEKHFTLDRGLPGPDHKASLEPDELKAMVSAIRNVDIALGSADKFVTEAERGNVNAARKSIVAARPIAKGEMLTEENLTAKRPGGGISPMEWERLIGTPSPADLLPDQPFPDSSLPS